MQRRCILDEYANKQIPRAIKCEIIKFLNFKEVPKYTREEIVKLCYLIAEEIRQDQV